MLHRCVCFCCCSVFDSMAYYAGVCVFVYVVLCLIVRHITQVFFVFVVLCLML